MGLLGKDSSPEEFPASVSMSGEGAPGPTLPCGSKLRPGRELHGKPQGPSQAQGKAPMPGKGATPTPGSRGPTLWRGPQRPPGLFSYSRAGVFSLTRALALDGTGPPPPQWDRPPTEAEQINSPSPPGADKALACVPWEPVGDAAPPWLAEGLARGLRSP